MTTETPTLADLDAFLEGRVTEWKRRPLSGTPLGESLPEFLRMTPDEYAEWYLRRLPGPVYKRLERVWAGWHLRPVSIR